jgi:hypothetical protein
VKLSRDGWTGLAILAASLFLFWQTLGLKDSPLVPIGPGFYPRIVLGITAVLAAFLLFFSFRAPTRAEDGKGTENYALVFGIFLICGVYVGALPFLGFRIATLVFVAALQVALEFPANRKQWAMVAVTAIVTTLLTYVVFENYLTVLLPRGRWTDF